MQTSIVVMLLVLGTTLAAALSLGRHSNNIQQNEIKTGRRTASITQKDWVKIPKSPPSVVTVQLGERLELQCDANGSPAPTIQWLRGSTSVQKHYDRNEMNRIVEEHAGGIAKMSSHLVIDCVLPQHEDLYTCVATSAAQSVSAPPTMVLIEGSSTRNITALLEACSRAEQNQVRIVEWYRLMLQTIGEQVRLRCRAEGDPTPDVYWMDVEENILPNSNPRYQVLPDGDLVISHLRWSDMGEYTCVATSGSSRDIAKTFLYPVQDEDESE